MGGRIRRRLERRRRLEEEQRRLENPLPTKPYVKYDLLDKIWAGVAGVSLLCILVGFVFRACTGQL